MNAVGQTHPTPDQLAAFGAGKLNAVESDEIELHLAECDACCQTLKELPESDTLVALLRDPEADTSVIAEKGSQIAATISPEALQDRTIVPAGDATESNDQASVSASLNLPPELRDHPRYRIVELLGRGGMGDVYRAEHKVMNRTVALKVIKPQLVQDDAAVRRFRREVQAAARLDHANIVTAHDAEQAGDLHYLVMEFVDGVDLNEVIRDRGALPVDESCEYIRQTAEALQHAHELGMVHRDIKPHNLMVERSRVASGESPGAETSGRSGSGISTVDSRPFVKVLDFGLANFASETAAEDVEAADAQHHAPAADVLHQLTEMGTMMGTPDYIAPEQAEDAHTADIRSDIYSLGCTFYTLLAGHPPFGEGSVADKIQAHTQHDAPPLADFRDDVSPQVEAILQKMIAKDPADRYQSPAEVAEALCSLPAQGNVSGSGKPTPQAAGQSSSRRMRVATIVAAFVVLAMIALGAIIYVKTDNGTLVIKTQDPNARIRIRQNGDAIKTIDVRQYVDKGDTHPTKAGNGTRVHVDLRSGEYEIELLGNGGTLTLSKDRVTIRRGHEDSIQIWREQNATPPDALAELAEVRQIAKHTGEIRKMNASADGRRVLTGSEDGSVVVRELQSGKEILRVKRAPGAYFTDRLSPDGKLALATGEDQRLRLYDVDTGRELHRFPHAGRATAFDGDSRLAAICGGDTTIRIWDAKERKEIDSFRLPDPGAINDIEFSPDGQTLLVGRDGGFAHLVTVSTGEIVKSWETALHQIKGVACSPDGRHVAWVGTPSPAVYVADLSDPEKREFSLVGSTDQNVCVEFTRDGRYVLSGGFGQTIRVWNLGSRKQVATFTGHRRHIEDLAALPDGRHVVSAAEDGTLRLLRLPQSAWSENRARHGDLVEVRRLEGQTKRSTGIHFLRKGTQAISSCGDGGLRIWDLKTGDLVRTLDDPKVGALSSVAVSADERFAVTTHFAHVGQIHVWDLESGKAVQVIDVGRVAVFGTAFLPEKNRIVSGTHKGQLQVWDLISGKEVGDPIAFDRANALAVTPAGQVLVGASHGSLRLLDLSNGETIHNLHGHIGAVHNIAISPDGSMAATASSEGQIALWDLNTGHLVSRLRGHVKKVEAVAFTPDGRHILSGGWDRTLRVWSVAQLREMGRVETQNRVSLELAVSPDGRSVLAAGGEYHDGKRWVAEGDYAIRVWRLKESIWPTTIERITEVRRIEGHTGTVKSVAISPDGKRAASASGWPFGDGSLRLWDPQTGNQIRQFKGHADQVMRVVFSPDGRQLLSGSADQTARVWDVETGKQVALLPDHEGWVEGIAFLPDGRRVLTGSSCIERNGKIRLWDIKTGTVLQTFGDDNGKVLAIAVSPRWSSVRQRERRELPNLGPRIGGSVANSQNGHSGRQSRILPRWPLRGRGNDGGQTDSSLG